MCVYNSLTVHGILYCTMYTWRFQRFQRKTAHKMLNPIRRVIVGLSLVVKFGLHPIYSFGDMALFIFRCFGLKLPIPAHFLWVRGLGAYFPKIWPPIVLTPKRTILARKQA